MTKITKTKQYVESNPALKRVKGDMAAHQARKKIEQWKRAERV